MVELGVGLWTRSVTVTSDAFHTFSAVGGELIALTEAGTHVIAVHFSSLPRARDSVASKAMFAEASRRRFP